MLRLVQTNALAIAGGAAWSIAGRLGPFAIAVAMTPLLIHALGDVRWGIFTLALSLLNISGLFDLGLGRALTRELAERIADADAAGAARVTVTALLASTLAGLTAAILAGGGVALWIGYAGVLPDVYRAEAEASLLLLCAAIPLMLINAGLWGVLTAFQQFRAGNLVNLAVSCLYYVLPWLALGATDSLVAAMAALLLTRLVWTVCYATICLRLLPGLPAARPSMAVLRALLRRGGWMTLSNFAYPLLSYLDRFVVGFFVSPVESGFYNTLADVVLRLGIISAAITSSVYPVIAATYRNAAATTARAFLDSAKAILALVMPLAGVLVVFGKSLLVLWLGRSFADNTGSVLPILAVGLLFSALDGLVATLIDGIGRPEANAKMSGVQLVLFVPLLVILINRFGITGAAIAWSARTVLDLGLRSWFAASVAPMLRPALRDMLWRAGLAGLLLVGLELIAATLANSVLGALLIAAMLPLVAFGIFSRADRARLAAIICTKLPGRTI